MKNQLLKHIFRKIKNNYKRFLSLFCMSLLGVGFYAGIQASGPDILKTLDKFYDDNNVYDIEIISTLGLTNNDIESIKKIKDIDKVYGTYSKDVYFDINNEELVLRVIGLSNVNKVYLDEGRLPKNNNEVVVENRLLSDNSLKVGDNISFLDKEFNIVGVVTSPLYYSNQKPTTTLGNGKINYFAYTFEDVIKEDVFTNIYVTVRGTKDELTNSVKYLDKVDNAVKEINKIKISREEDRYNELYRSIIYDAKNYGISIDESNLIYPKWYILTREDNVSYNEVINASDNLAKIGTVFPLIFFLIAVLVSLISMMRMIEEDRIENGTLKSLGFNSFQITSKYIIFSLSATIIGGVVGIIIGCVLIPSVIWDVYKKLFYIPFFIYEIHNITNIIGLLICIFCICGTAIFVCVKNLRNEPAKLMRPKPPKSGKKILLERVPFIWKRLKFSNKITIRNIFRYKSRVITTIFGIAGCTSLILAGFGLKDSIKDVANHQFNHILNYDKMVMLKENDDYDELKKELGQEDKVKGFTEINVNNITLEYKDDSQKAVMIVPENNEELSDFIILDDFNNKDKVNLIPEDNSCIISEKTSKLLNINVNDKVILTNDKDEKFEIKVKYIIKNYIDQYLYITKNTYEDVFGEYKVNALLLDTKKMNDEDNDLFDEKYLEREEVSSIRNISDIKDNVNKMLDSIDSIVAILIIAAALLAFVVLYNLSNINISERKREIATLKVLGFYNREVDNYITRETIILTILGIGLGLYIGSYLSHYIISTCEPDFIMFIRHVDSISYFIAAIITTIFTIIVNIVTHYNLKSIDMIESLKNVE